MSAPTPFAEILRRHSVTASSVAAGLGINKATVSRWHAVPADRVIEVERVTGISRHELRPDLSRIFIQAAPAKAGEVAA